MAGREQTFAVRLRAAREAAGLSQEELAERAGLTPNSVGALERGEHRHPYPATVRALATALGLSASDQADLAAAVPRRSARGDATLEESVPLPVPPTSFVGREEDVRAVIALLQGSTRSESVRLLTLTGPGGVGKTRLALAVAEEIASSFEGGMVLVDLAPIRDPGLVVSAIAHSLGVNQTRNRDKLEGLLGALRDREILLVLDNFEQVVEAGPVLARMMAGCRQLHLLVTSRVVLRLAGERSYPVQPLGLPDPDGQLTSDQLVESAAVRLFVERARVADPGFALTPTNAQAIAAICRRLDGLPLALELAAARIRHLQPDALLPRLAHRLPLLMGGPRDAPARQRTLRDALAWSYELLDAECAAVFRRLAVFTGGFSLDAADYVSREPNASRVSTADADVLTAISVLIDESLVVRMSVPGEFAVGAGESRFTMLETIREFGVEQVTEREEERAARDRHAAFFLELAERNTPSLVGPARGQAVAKLDRDYLNLRSALEWFVAQGRSEEGLRLASALAGFGARRDYLAEGLVTLERLLADTDPAPSPVRARALIGAGTVARIHADLARSERLLREALKMTEDLGGESLGYVPLIMRELGEVEVNRGDFDRADELLREGVALARANDNQWMETWNLEVLGVVAYARRDYAGAYDRFLEVRPLVQRYGDEEAYAIVVGNLGWVSLALGKLDQAAGWYAAYLDMAGDISTRYAISWGLDGVAALAGLRGDGYRAARIFGASESIRVANNIPVPPVVRENYDRYVVAARGTIGDEAFDAAWAAGRELPRTQLVAEARELVAGASGPTESPSSLTLSSRYGLTPREADVLRLLAQRWTDKEIAAALFVSPRTVTSHVTGILNKLGVSSRREAAALAAREGLV